MKYDEFDTHREALIGWFKFTSSITILHNTTRSKVETALLNATLRLAEISKFTPVPDTNNEDNETTKHNNNTINRGAIRAMKILILISN